MKRLSNSCEPTDDQLRRLGKVIHRARIFVRSISENRPEIIKAHLDAIKIEAADITNDWDDLTNEAYLCNTKTHS